MKKEKRKIRVLTLNIHKGFLFSNQNSTLDKTKSLIQEMQADVVCLQEVLGHHVKHAPKPQFEYLADQIWGHFAYGKNAIYSKGHHGNAILSHFPFISQENINISNHRYEQRGILHGIVGCPEWQEDKLHVMTVHLDLFSWGRRRQLDKLCQLIDKNVRLQEPIVVTGDFNDWAEEATHYLKERVGLDEAHLAHTGAHARTFPSKIPVLKLDRIYFRDLKVHEAFCMNLEPWKKLSDHLALVADLEW